MNNVQKQYFREIKKSLSCSSAQKKSYLTELDSSVSSFLQQHPMASVHDLHIVFGDPHSIAASFLEQTSPDEYSHRLSLKRKIALGVISIVAILAVVIGIIAFSFTNTLQDFYDGYYVDDVTVYDTLPSEAELEPLPIAEY